MTPAHQANVPNDEYEVSQAVRESCKQNVLLLFEDLCPIHLDNLAEQHGFKSCAIIDAILEQQENGHLYPRKERLKKRKREDDQYEAEDKSKGLEAQIDNPTYMPRMSTRQYKDMATNLISQDFPRIPKDEAIRNWDDANATLPWKNKITPSKALPEYSHENITRLPLEKLTEHERAAIDEFLLARAIKKGKDAEAANFKQASLNGEIQECGCCFDEQPLNRMVHCEGEAMHWFCRGCMKQQAETVIGQSKYKLTCVSMDGCNAGFSVAQRSSFLDKKLQIALDRIEQQTVLELAGIENLESCPFCPFAMEYPPVEENKEFRCANPDCETVSCRLCRRDTHVPRSCEEAALDDGYSARHLIEEAMSEAMIRRCNKCANPYIKTDGCNKITCTKCGTLQCYVCRKNVQSYNHFNDSARGGKADQCPLFDSNTEDRHIDEVRRAEEATRTKVAQENPELNDETLRIKLSSSVDADEKKRREKAQRQPQFHRVGPNRRPVRVDPLAHGVHNDVGFHARQRAQFEAVIAKMPFQYADPDAFFALAPGQPLIAQLPIHLQRPGQGIDYGRALQYLQTVQQQQQQQQQQQLLQQRQQQQQQQALAMQQIQGEMLALNPNPGRENGHPAVEAQGRIAENLFLLERRLEMRATQAQHDALNLAAPMLVRPGPPFYHAMPWMEANVLAPVPYQDPQPSPGPPVQMHLMPLMVGGDLNRARPPHLHPAAAPSQPRDDMDQN